MKSFPQSGELTEVDPQVSIEVGCAYQSVRFSVSHFSSDLGNEILQFLRADLAIAVSIKQFKCLKDNSS